MLCVKTTKQSTTTTHLDGSPLSTHRNSFPTSPPPFVYLAYDVLWLCVPWYAQCLDRVVCARLELDTDDLLITVDSHGRDGTTGTAAAAGGQRGLVPALGAPAARRRRHGRGRSGPGRQGGRQHGTRRRARVFQPQRHACSKKEEIKINLRAVYRRTLTRSLTHSNATEQQTMKKQGPTRLDVPHRR